MFVPGSIFQPSLVFVSMACIYPDMTFLFGRLRPYFKTLDKVCQGQL
jgi:hypothetical protein